MRVGAVPMILARIGHFLTLGGWAIAALIAARLAFGLFRFARLPALPSELPGRAVGSLPLALARP